MRHTLQKTYKIYAKLKLKLTHSKVNMEGEYEEKLRRLHDKHGAEFHELEEGYNTESIQNILRLTPKYILHPPPLHPSPKIQPQNTKKKSNLI